MRYEERLPLPSYRHVPGQTPHPISDPDGHRMMGIRVEEPPIELARWRDSVAYRYAVDLFNHGFYWEAHEVWEGLWRAAGRAGPTADFLKGLIKLAAALVKSREGRSEGVRRHGRRAGELFAAVAAHHGPAAQAPIGGLMLDELGTMAERLAQGDARMPFRLSPR